VWWRSGWGRGGTYAPPNGTDVSCASLVELEGSKARKGRGGHLLKRSMYKCKQSDDNDVRGWDLSSSTYGQAAGGTASISSSEATGRAIGRRVF
jgi:hypothetical protein